MAITFPNSPTVGQQYVAENGYTYEYDGEKWSTLPDSEGQIPAGGTTGQFLAKVNDTDYNMEWTDAAPPTSIGTTPPTGDLEDGQLWWRSDTGVLYIYYGDGDSSQWVQAAVGMDTRVQAEVYTGDVPPLGPGEGDLWWNTTDTNLYVYYQSVWVQSNPVPPEQPNYWQRDAATGVVSPSTSGDDVQIASLNSGPLAGFRNQILNPQFEITQRGTTSDTAGAFTCDRWRNNSNREQVVIDEIGQIPGNYSSGISSVNAGDTLSIRQSIELPVDKNNNCQSGPFSSGSEWIISLQVIDRGGAGGTITPTLGWSDSSAASGTVATDAPIAAQSTTSAWTKYTFAVRIDGTPATSDRCLNLNLVATGTGTPAITAVQLEPGPVATPFEQRPIGTELALCQRYYCQGESFIKAAAPGGGTIGSKVFFPSTMRATPTCNLNLTIGNNGVLDYYEINGVVVAGTPNAAGDLKGNYTADAEL
ncbi:tail fiber protein [Synechococcus phage S-N03]|uniref:Tail fiber protein n=1 Tax=Synechococcus phage S-N03 TaxID=2718943 RepID=A0A6G8R5J3_9CAUD|nr:tail collar fiber protein [Synechococcus phage S-N03]QIN96643.1 tail fiber protein [Synechococcus phage S-N03]